MLKKRGKGLVRKGARLALRVDLEQHNIEAETGEEGVERAKRERGRLILMRPSSLLAGF